MAAMPSALPPAGFSHPPLTPCDPCCCHHCHPPLSLASSSLLSLSLLFLELKSPVPRTKTGPNQTSNCNQSYRTISPSSTTSQSSPVLSFHPCRDLLEPSRTRLDQFSNQLICVDLNHNKYMNYIQKVDY